MIFATTNIFKDEETQKVFLDRVDELTLGKELQVGTVWNENNMKPGEGNIDNEQRRCKVKWIEDKPIRYEVSVSYTHLTLPTICSV